MEKVGKIIITNRNNVLISVNCFSPLGFRSSEAVSETSPLELPTDPSTSSTRSSPDISSSMTNLPSSSSSSSSLSLRSPVVAAVLALGPKENRKSKINKL